MKNDVNIKKGLKKKRKFRQKFKKKNCKRGEPETIALFIYIITVSTFKPKCFADKVYP